MEQATLAGQRARTGGMGVFMLIWVGQLISLLGSGLTDFALGVWVYKLTGSATQLTLIAFFAIIPFIAFSPVAGALVDRWDRRWALIASEAGASITPLVLALLIATGNFAVWQVYVVVAISSAFRAFQFPAFTAATTLLVPKEQYGRASGLVQIAGGVAQLLSPVLAGVLLALIEIEGIFLIDIVTFALSVGTLLIVRIPRPETSAEGRAARGSLLRESIFGWTYITARPGLLALLLFFAASNFLMGTITVLVTPLVLAFASPTVLGTVLSIAGVGILAGSLIMGAWGGPKRRVYGVLGSTLLSGVCMILAGLAPSAILIGAMAFFFAVGAPIAAGCSQAIWQRKVAPDLQGRVFGIRAMIAMSALPLAYVLGGPLTDYVFNPLLATGGPLADSVGQVIGSGPGRGIGLLFIVLGFLTIVAVIVGMFYPRLRLVEEELPDVIADEAPAEATASAQDLAGVQPQLESV